MSWLLFFLFLKNSGNTPLREGGRGQTERKEGREGDRQRGREGGSEGGSEGVSIFP